MTARSFCTTADSADAVSRILRETRDAVRTPAGGLVFVADSHAARLDAIAERVANAWKGVPTLVVPSAGVLHERAEIEGQVAASGILWSGGSAAPFALGASEDDPRTRGEAIGRAIDPRASSTLVFHIDKGFDPVMLEGIAEVAPSSPCVFGAGMSGGAGRIVTAEGERRAGSAVGMSIRGLASPIVASSSACRLVSELLPIEDVSAGLVLRLGARSALDELSRCASSVTGAKGAMPQVFAALADPDDLGDDGKPRFVIRPVRGIDPSRRGVMIGESARPSMHMGFAVRDAEAARSSLETMARSISRNALGAAPRFALYLASADRGQSLYGAPDAEIRVLRQRFGDLPIAGMRAAFEISPRRDKPSRMELSSGVLALFRSPS